jgi:hypothetical protein
MTVDPRTSSDAEAIISVKAPLFAGEREPLGSEQLRAAVTKRPQASAGTVSVEGLWLALPLFSVFSPSEH